MEKAFSAGGFYLLLSIPQVKQNDADSASYRRTPTGGIRRSCGFFQSSSPRGTPRAALVPGNYHSNLLPLTTLPTINLYELPSALILPG